MNRGRNAAWRCTYCGGAIRPGAEYWAWNGALVCGECLPELARRELEPCREVRGKEARP